MFLISRKSENTVYQMEESDVVKLTV